MRQREKVFRNKQVTETSWTSIWQTARLPVSVTIFNDWIDNPTCVYVSTIFARFFPEYQSMDGWVNKLT